MAKKLNLRPLSIRVVACTYIYGKTTLFPFHFVKPAAVLSSLLLLAAVSSGPAREFHVSPDGNDAGDGGPGAPFATIPRAQKAVREARKASPSEPMTVILHGGPYVLSQPIAFTPDDSGTPAAPVTFEAAPGEHPVVSGGRRIKAGWKPGKNGIWTAEIPEVKSGQWFFRQLFVNGESRPLARSPNAGFFRVAGFPDGGLTPPPDQIHQRFAFRKGDIDPGWKRITDARVIVYNYWTDYHLPIASVDAQTSVVTFTHPSRYPFLDGNKGSTLGARYIVENVLEALDQPGEWYLDRAEGVLSYLPKEGEDMARAEIVAPAVPSLLRLEGDPKGSRWVENVRFKGITFEYTRFELPEGNVNFPQGGNSLPGAVVLTGARSVRFEHCLFRNLGAFAFDIQKGCKDDQFVGNVIEHVAGGGFRINGGTDADAPAWRTSRLEIADNEVGHFGEVYASAVGILLMNADGCRIAHNWVHHGNYTGISIGWKWGYARSVSWNNVVEFNHIHDIGQHMLSDLGGIYTLGISPGTVIRNNLIHGVTIGLNYGFGIYHDEGSTHILDENNIVYDTEWAPFHINYGKEIEARNNIFVNGGNGQISRGHMQPHDSVYFENNIVYWKGDVPLFVSDWKDVATPYNILVLDNHKPVTSSSTFVSDWNVYFNPAFGADQIKLGDGTWRQWNERGKDVHSVIADPLFVDPAKNDFRLRPESPALKMGFCPIDMSQVGPRSTPGPE